VVDLPPPPPLSGTEIVGHIRDHWMQNIGADWDEASFRAERGFMHMLQTHAIREWGFNNEGETLYEPVTSIVYVLIQGGP